MLINNNPLGNNSVIHCHLGRLCPVRGYIKLKYVNLGLIQKFDLTKLQQEQTFTARLTHLSSIIHNPDSFNLLIPHTKTRNTSLPLHQSHLLVANSNSKKPISQSDRILWRSRGFQLCYFLQSSD